MRGNRNGATQSIRQNRSFDSREGKMRDLDPARVRVVLIKFGIVKTSMGYDLGVVEFQWEEIPTLSSKVKRPSDRFAPAKRRAAATHGRRRNSLLATSG